MYQNQSYHSAQQANAWKITGLSIYSLSLLGLFAFSTLHHGVNAKPKVNELLRTLDYISVFLLIAGTATPLVLVVYRNVYGWAVLGSVWGIAAIGITLRAVHTQLPKYITNTLYIVLGWIPVALLADKPHLPLGAILLLSVGGITYSLGFIIYIYEKPNIKPGRFGFHELWHCFIIVAALLHYLLMYLYILK